jgi:hypothetical protein
MLLVFGGMWNDGANASMYKEIMLRNVGIFQISTLVCLSSITICNLLIDLRISHKEGVNSEDKKETDIIVFENMERRLCFYSVAFIIFGIRQHNFAKVHIQLS